MNRFEGLTGFFTVSSGIIVMLLGYLVPLGPNYYDYTICRLGDYETRVKERIYAGKIRDLIVNGYNDMFGVEMDENDFVRIDHEKTLFALSKYNVYDKEIDRLNIEVDDRISRMNFWYKPYCAVVCFLFGALYLSLRGLWASCKQSVLKN